MCCPLSSQQPNISHWQRAGLPTESCPRAQKVQAVVGSLFAVIAVGGIIWGGYDVCMATVNQNSELLKEGLVVLAGAAISGIVSTVAWTCICISCGEPEGMQQASIV